MFRQTSAFSVLISLRAKTLSLSQFRKVLHRVRKRGDVDNERTEADEPAKAVVRIARSIVYTPAYKLIYSV